MITQTEHVRIQQIKAAIASGGPASISAVDKQWILDMLNREQGVLSTPALRQAQGEGFNVRGIKTR